MIEHIQVIPDKCRACRRCEVACIAAHHGMTFKEAMKHRDVLVSRVQVVKAEGFKTTVRCHQCNPAPCCNICPTGALRAAVRGLQDVHRRLPLRHHLAGYHRHARRRRRDHGPAQPPRSGRALRHVQGLA